MRSCCTPIAAAQRHLVAKCSAHAAMASGSAEFKLSKTARLILVQGDLTKSKTDAIVNAANEGMLGGGGVDGAIHSAAGPDLLKACKYAPEVKKGVRCPTGHARATLGYKLPARFVIHTVGPVYRSKAESEPLLRQAYESSLDLAQKLCCRTVAFPAISCGVYGYPLHDAAKVSIEACKASAGSLDSVQFVLFSREAYITYEEAAKTLLQEA